MSQKIEMTDRREFLRDIGRYTVAGAMFVVSGAMAVNAFEKDCVNHRTCNTCMVFDGCELPFKQADAQPLKQDQRPDGPRPLDGTSDTPERKEG